jgi:molybdenum cofactor cytidylyltransferase
VQASPACPEGHIGAPAMIAAVVLAGGASTRMGRPKALLRHGGRSFVACAVELAAQAGCAPIVVVTGAQAIDEPLPALRVHNERWALGQLSSLQRGLTALTDPPGVLVLTVDRPHLRPATISALLAAFRGAPDHIWQTEHAGRRGHPLIWPAALLPALAALPPTADPRALLREHAALRRCLPVDDPATLDNLDRPEDLARLP